MLLGGMVVASFVSKRSFAAETIKIGVPTPLSGNGADVGAGVRRAIDYAVEEANSAGGVIGRQLEARYLDTEFKADIARQQAEKLARGGYNILIGLVSSSEALAIAPNLGRWNALCISTVPKADQITESACRRRYFRVNPPDYADTPVIKAWLTTRSEGKWSFVGDDYAWGHVAAANFRKLVESLGRMIVSEDFVTPGTTDFAPYIQKMLAAGAQGIWVVCSGAGAIAFTQQASQFQLLKGRVVGGASYITDAMAQAIGKITAGIYGVINYSPAIDTPANRAFVEGYTRKYPGKAVNLYDAHTYLGMQVLLQAITRAGSSEPEKLVSALSGGTFHTIKGEQIMRAADNQLLGPNYFGRVEDVNGRLMNVITLSVSSEVTFPPPSGSCRLT
jgi:branched-chain amino acid transport system substrate-binding protein